MELAGPIILIGDESPNQGVEAGATLAGPAGTSVFANYTQQDATSGFGDHAGRYLKAVPRRVLAAGVARTPADGPAVALTATRVQDVFLDVPTDVLPPRLELIELPGLGGGKPDLSQFLKK